MSQHLQINNRNFKVVVALNGQRDADVIMGTVRVPVLAAAASTTVIADDKVPPGYRIHVTGIRVQSSGAAWTGGTNIILQDSSATAFLTIVTAQLPTATTSTWHAPHFARGTSTTGVGLATGSAVGKGLVVAQTGTYSGAAIVYVEVDYIMRTDTSETFA